MHALVEQFEGAVSLACFQVCATCRKYCIEGNFRVAKYSWVFVVEGLTTNILPTNEATLLTFTCSASSNHQNITHEMSQYNYIAKPRIFCPPKITRYTVVKIQFMVHDSICIFI